MPVDPKDLDTATLAFVTGSAANDLLLGRIRAAGHDRVRIAHGYVFQHLIEGTPTVGELARALDVTQQAASKTTCELEELGYLTRRADAIDGRVTRLELTERGRHVIEVARLERAALEEDLVQAAGRDKVDMTRSVLAALLSLTGREPAVRQRSLRPQ